MNIILKLESVMQMVSKDWSHPKLKIIWDHSLRIIKSDPEISSKYYMYFQVQIKNETKTKFRIYFQYACGGNRF